MKQVKNRRKQEASLAETTGSKTRHERPMGRPDTGDLTDPTEVWRDAETTPQGEPRRGQTKALGQRVADAGDLKGGEPSPYDIEVQADSIANRTQRDKGSTKKTKK
ncbi:hypothetical protein SO078_30705 (plasmid) [Sinorhizobium meliloti]|uniref:hypothetical protein n=1 Tax=Rhizobium meliloti TaxID=382 RepID=UPI002D77E8EB|nr:hypothetical protein [Sinorhizobium meliloti]WRQ71897.1 hypothetical protein SO078_30705 [Sinorhizobium meliloti]